MKHSGTVKGDLVVNVGDDISALTSVGGWLDVREGAQIDAPALTSVGGGLCVREGAQIDAPALTKVAGHDLPDAVTARDRLVAVAHAALADPANLDMSRWHNESGGCGTAHCIAGWAVHLAGTAGYELEAQVGQPAAGNILLGVEASALFYIPNDEARSALHRVLAVQQ